MPPSVSAPYFDTIAEEYAEWYQAQTPGGYALRIRQQRVLELLDQREGKVLDVGCGPGILGAELTKLGHEYWGVDTSPGMIQLCEERFGENKNMHFSVESATRLSFPTESFDTVICLGVIERIPAYEAALGEMIRVLKKGGTIVISFPNLVSPYGAWKNFAFYPAVARLRPAYYRLIGRPQPASLYTVSKGGGAFSSHNWLYTLHGATETLRRLGAEVAEAVYFNFNLFLSPLDDLLPRPSLEVTKKLERLRFSWLKWLGSGFIVKARKYS